MRPGVKLRRAVARIAVTLRGIAPPVMRRMEAPLSLRLDRLHLALQAAMGWSDYHRYEFRIGEQRWGVADAEDGDDPPVAAEATTLGDALRDSGARAMLYRYDFGDGWEHDIDLERIAEADPTALYPRLLEAAGRCPPEDVGGPQGYAEFLAALIDPAHANHRMYLTWSGGGFDPSTVDREEIDAELADLARAWGQLRVGGPSADEEAE